MAESDKQTTSENNTLSRPAEQSSIQGVVIGVLIGFDSKNQPLVAFPGNAEEVAVPALSTKVLSEDDIGKQIALLFEGGDPHRPLIIGLIQRLPADEQFIETVDSEKSISVTVDGNKQHIKANEEIVLQCGKASITLTKAGKIILRGAYISSYSAGVNRIKGGSVQIN